ncbi:MAG: hypothetical protein R3F48_07815 [Candidatus Zixiibacteriota bacterium]
MENRYKLIGWTAILSSVFMLPELGATNLLAHFSRDMNYLYTLIGLGHCAWFLCQAVVLYHFKHLLNERCNFTSADKILYLLVIFAGIQSAFYGIFAVPGMTDRLLMTAVVLFIPYCILLIILGIMLLRVEENLYGLLRPYSIVINTAGIIGLMVFLMSVSLIVMMISQIMIGIMFLRTREQVEFV